MTRNSWIALCLAYIVALLSTNIFTVASSGFASQQLCILISGLSGLTLVSTFVFRKLRIPTRVWWGTAIVAILAIFYFQLRIPQPSINDISYQIKTTETSVDLVLGKVVTEPRLNSSNKLKFWLETKEINHQEKVSGKLYVSISLLQGTGIDLGEEIEIKGILYTPKSAITSGGFDFKAYLARRGIFAGMQGLEVISNHNSEPVWGWWKLRRRIIRSHLRGLGSPVGQLVSSMVLGRKAVDLSPDIRDRFINAGLAHVLAASGFHVSLLLGLILKLTNRFAAKPQLIIGICTLIIYLGLTGIQASVLRACLMGSAVLIAMASETKVKPLGSLLLAATLILLLNPLLIGDLGFQLSFLATFGLIATMPYLQSALDWLPSTIATLVAVPVAASMWVLPLLCYEFNTVATYSIIVNILCTPLIMAISLGGMISAIASIVFPLAGSAIAWLLFYPTLLLLKAIDFFTSLPGSSWAIGQISLGVLLTIYGLLLSIWLNQKWRKNWRLILTFALTLIIVPVSYQHFHLTQITILPIQPEPAIIIQDRGKVVLVNSGKPKTFQYTVLPFLTRQGINHLDYYIDLEQQDESNSISISDRISIDRVVYPQNTADYAHNSDLSIETNSFKIIGDRQLSVLKLETTAETWLILGKTEPNYAQIKRSTQQEKPLTIVSSSLSSDWLELSPENIISSSSLKVTQQNTNTLKSSFYNLKKRGALTWTPQDGIRSTHNTQSFNSIF